MNWVFVYAADSGFWNWVFDSVHKILSPSTYACRLCAVTHGIAGVKREWEEAKRRLHGRLEFYHRDEFVRRYPDIRIEAPCVYRVENDEWRLAIGGKDWESIRTVEDLIQKIESFK